ncbi:hypothetical protein LMG28138_05775 [Pararobbsia alpina]|uniref:Integrase DNA-binding domain-containing protein n=1 Tax=Pararobbsia alpina TaxID=621374 RepID=A0A6S7BP60_9BURK|nr:hypothetical protein LMG28138_05775 [Pararobbsia alpina]
MNLTDLTVRNTKPKDKPYKLTDGDGMFLLVQPNGGKYWRLAYRYLGKQKTLALGVTLRSVSPWRGRCRERAPGKTYRPLPVAAFSSFRI